MNSWAPRCSDALSLMSVPACCSVPPEPAAKAVKDSSNPPASARMRVLKVLVMRSHPLRHRLGLVDLRPKRHGDEEGEIEEGQHAADVGLDDIGTGTGTDLAQPHEGDGEQA